MKNSTGSKIIKGIITGIILTFLTLIVLITMVIWLFITGGPAKSSDNIEDYGDIFELRLNSGLVVFPEEISTDVVEGEFYYNYRDTWDDPTYQIYLRCTYEPEDFNRECQRLEGVQKKGSIEEEKLQRDEEGKFAYPAYIAIENQNYGYEYALLTGKNEITYVCTNFVKRKGIRFDKKYLPEDFMTDEGRAFGSGYSIYMLSDGSGGSYQVEYDRDMYVPNAEEENQ